MSEPIRPGALALRVARITGAAVLAGVRAGVLAAASPRGARAERAAAELARLAERLGGAFVKVGQLAGTRPDLVGPVVAGALGRLHDGLPPMPPAQARLAVRRAFPRPPDGLAAAITGPPVASGSIASVYRVRTGGRLLALKVRRPDVGRVMAADLAVMNGFAALAERLPGLRRVPLTEITGRLGRCLAAQLDFAAEAANLARMREHLAGFPDLVVPAVVPELCGDGVIAMEYVEGLGHASIEGVAAPAREAEVAALVRAVYHLLFVEGFVHVDLHQGNTYFLPDGRVVLLDAGFAFRLGDLARRRFTAFFGGMIRGDGESCADILRSTVRGAAGGRDDAAFRREVAALVRRNAGAAVRDFNLPAFCAELFNLQRRHGLYAEPEFVFPMLCLLSLDGLVKEHYPLMDFQMEAAPFVMRSLLTEPEGP
ncbi:AarF/ABC1/UbiB kinase family protein [Actinomadura sp. NEAU-AAG7]|uniref:ABC1 kinase family protein n=1 Tax=Actinomadura sp. NEAU-AAG7 TaxID=2839640 RepID=UPI001BE47DB0|nr:AarF/ABC1/UbiB kinase family protein [Actinomadura sp. NEAU-AAG7]MBT2212770.1 hypothetical protein [Actinomadura sp. NEAU-AAG7]